MDNGYVENGYVECGYFIDDCVNETIKPVLKVFGFSKNIKLDDMTSDEFQIAKAKQNRKYGITAVVFSEVNT